MQSLRPYQIECKRTINEAFASNRRVLAVLATGLGKTTIAADLARDAASTLFIAHRKELIEQAYARLLDHTGRAVGIEMASKHSHGESIVVGSVQSLLSRVLAPPELIIVDEAHHAVSATYQTVLERFPGAKILGLTATPDRTDGRPLEEVFDYVAFRYETPQAIADGWLAPIFTKKAHGVSGLIAEVGSRKTVVFTPSVREAMEVAGMLPGATYVHGGVPSNTRTERIEAFTRGDFQYMVNCNILTEGFDSPTIGCVAMMRATESRALFVQCLDSETEVLTPAGWKTISDEIPTAYAYNIENGEIKSSSAQKVIRSLGGEYMYGIKNNHLDVRVTAGHRMVVSKRIRVNGCSVDNDQYFCSAESITGENYIPVAGNTVCPEAEISDWDLTFLGLVLSDGHVNYSNNCITITQSNKYPEIVEIITKTLLKCGFRYGHRLHTKDTNFGPRSPLNEWWISKGNPRRKCERQLTGWARLEPWINGKNLTAEYEKLSHRQVAVLLQAIQYGDGDKNIPVDYDRNTYNITLQNPLADQLQSLLVRRGFRCNIKKYDTYTRLRVSQDSRWSIKCFSSDSRPVWERLPSNPDELVWCVTVDTGAIVTRRNGKVAIVGNCLGRGLRLAPGKSDCLFLDLVDMPKHSLEGPRNALAGRPGRVKAPSFLPRNSFWRKLFV